MRLNCNNFNAHPLSTQNITTTKTSFCPRCTRQPKQAGKHPRQKRIREEHSKFWEEVNTLKWE
eukprot:5109545-Ditylum_brightwellii.AAC.1